MWNWVKQKEDSSQVKWEIRLTIKSKLKTIIKQNLLTTNIQQILLVNDGWKIEALENGFDKRNLTRHKFIIIHLQNQYNSNIRCHLSNRGLRRRLQEKFRHRHTRLKWLCRIRPIILTSWSKNRVTPCQAHYYKLLNNKKVKITRLMDKV